MQSGTYECQSEFARLYVAKGREEGFQKGREEGWKAGWKEGWKEGRDEGREEGERAAVFEVLNARGVWVEEGARQRIQSCTDLSQLKRWLRKAVSVQATQELFEP